MINVNVFNQTEVDLTKYEKILIDLFSSVEEEGNFSVIFVGNEQIKLLNKTYRNIDEPTDVLSFISDEEDYFGDVFISLEQAKEQSKDYNHSLKREIAFLAVHGYLHLRGYDHETKEDEKVMNDLAEKILEKANIKRDKDE